MLTQLFWGTNVVDDSNNNDGTAKGRPCLGATAGWQTRSRSCWKSNVRGSVGPRKAVSPLSSLWASMTVIYCLDLRSPIHFVSNPFHSSLTALPLTMLPHRRALPPLGLNTVPRRPVSGMLCIPCCHQSTPFLRGPPPRERGCQASSV